MIGRKKLAQIRTELEAALGAGPAGEGEVAQSLRRFLARGKDSGSAPGQPSPTPGTEPPSKKRNRPRG